MHKPEPQTSQDKAPLAISHHPAPHDAAPPPSPKASAMTENRLAQETSPYLLQHKDNPVHWQAWGPEALAEARNGCYCDPDAGRILV